MAGIPPYNNIQLNKGQYDQWHSQQEKQDIQNYAPFGMSKGIDPLDPLAPPLELPIEAAPDLSEIWQYWDNPECIGRDWVTYPDPHQYTQEMKDHIRSDLIREPVFIKYLGDGAFGEVWKVSAEYDRLEGKGWDRRLKKRRRIWRPKIFAVKFIRQMSSRGQHIEKSFKDMRILRYLRHENICNICDIIGIPDTKTGFPYSIVCLFLEICHGNFFDYSPNLNGLPERLSRHWFAQIARALEYLHSNDVIHNDIKEPNILYKRRAPAYESYENRFLSSVFKLADFGISEFVDEITPQNTKKDLLSLSNVLFATQPGSSLQLTPQKLIDYCRTGIYEKWYPKEWEAFTKNFRKFLIKMSPDYNQNISMTAEDILEDPWLQNNNEGRREPLKLVKLPRLFQFQN